LIDSIDKEKYNVYALIRYVAGRHILGADINKYFADLTDTFSIRKIIKELHPEIVVHLASLSAVSYSYEHPQEVINNNLLGSVNLAETCLRENSKLEKFIFASTSETYGNHDSKDFPLTEESKQYPNSPYSLSKKSFEEYLKYMGKAYDFPYIIMRPFNTYGRKKNKHFVIERIITQMLTEDKIYLGDPTPKRDFLYVDDHVSAYLDVINSNKDILHEIFNFCTGNMYSIEEVVNTIKLLTKSDVEVYWNTIPKRPYDIDSLIGSYDKVNRVLGWYPKYTLQSGLEESIKYWRNNI